jgi:hypothetical protein
MGAEGQHNRPTSLPGRPNAGHTFTDHPVCVRGQLSRPILRSHMVAFDGQFVMPDSQRLDL